jgi:hypothetical protein
LFASHKHRAPSTYLLEAMNTPTYFPHSGPIPPLINGSWVIPTRHPPELVIVDSPFCDLVTIAKEYAKTWASSRRKRGIVSRIAKFSIKILRKSILNKTGLDILEISPLEKLQHQPLEFEIPCLFIHGLQDDFISTRHTTSLFQAYTCTPSDASAALTEAEYKRLQLVEGGHNSARIADAYQAISSMIFDFLLSPVEWHAMHRTTAAPPFGRTLLTRDHATGDVRNFMVRRIACCSRSPPITQIFPLVLSIRLRSHICFIAPFFEVIQGVIPFADLQRIWIDPHQPDLLVLQLKDQAHQRHFGSEFHGHSAYVVWSVEAQTILEWIRACFVDLQEFFASEQDVSEESSSPRAESSLPVSPASSST